MDSSPTKKKLFRCEICGEKFRRKPDLTLHVRFRENMTSEEYYKLHPIPDVIMNEFLREVVLSKIITNNYTQCWEWTGGKYGLYGRYGDEFAHRLSYRVFVGSIPEGKFICHKCNNFICVNPQHLYIGTHQDNMDDRMKSGNYKNFKHTDETKRKISQKLKDVPKPSGYISPMKNVDVVEKGLTMRRSKVNYICTSPNGEVYEVGILKEFCVTHGLCETNMFDVLAGRSTHHKKWTCKKVG